MIRTYHITSLQLLVTIALGQTSTKFDSPSEPIKPPSVAQNRLTLKDIPTRIEGRTLTIDDAVFVGLVANRQFALAINNLAKAKGRTEESKVSLMPKAGFGGQFTELDKEFDAAFGGGSIPITKQFNAAYQATISLPVDITGAAHAAISQAQFSEIAARIDVNRVRNQIVYDIRFAYFQALRAQAHLKVAQDSLGNRLQQLSDTEKNLSAGLASNFDVITAKRDVADAKQSVINSKAQITLSLASLKYVMGVDVSTHLSISDIGTEADTDGALGKQAPTPKDTDTSEDVLSGSAYRTALQEALESRPEVLETEATISATKRGIEYSRKSVLPELSLFASYNYLPDATDLSPSHQASVGLMLEIPVFDGGLARARRHQAIADLDTAKTNHRGAIDLVTLDVQQALVNIAQAQAKQDVARVGLAQATEAYRMAKVRFNNGITQSGVSPQLELSNAQTNLALAEANLLNARYDNAVAKSQLERAIGRYSYGSGPGYSTKLTKNVTGRARETAPK